MRPSGKKTGRHMENAHVPAFLCSENHWLGQWFQKA